MGSKPPAAPEGSSLLDASISDLLQALDRRQVTSVELVAKYLRRVCVYDANGPRLSAVPIINPNVFEEAAASDARRAIGSAARPLEGIPFLVKDNIKVKGMSIAAGSPAFEELVASDDAACVSVLRAAGAIVLGRTNMPPMANGGMQRGSYGRAESPYNLEFLTAAYASGSSNGSATGVAANFAAFGLGTETVSSGRSPASNNALVAYTPSRGLLPLRGVWHLYPTCDVLVPHTRTMEDMLRVLDILSVSDTCSTGDFWNTQAMVSLPPADEVRPKSFLELRKPEALRGKRLGVPSMYIGGSDPSSVPIRKSILDLWQRARKDLEDCGATVVDVDFPLVTNYENYEPDGVTWANIEGIPNNWLSLERCELIAHVWDDFLVANGQSGMDSLAQANPDLICPIEPGTLNGEVEEDNQLDWEKIVAYPHAKAKSLDDLPGMKQGLEALEQARKITLEGWMTELHLDAVVFPANNDVGRANADCDEASCEHAWRNGVLYSNGNLPMRHLGVPSVSVPMGIMEDTKMPVNLTMAGRAYQDNMLLELAYAFEKSTMHRTLPPLAPGLDSDHISLGPHARTKASGLDISMPAPTIVVTKRVKNVEKDCVRINLEGSIYDGKRTGAIETLTCYINGRECGTTLNESSWCLETSYSVSDREKTWTRWSSPALVQTFVILVGHMVSGEVCGEILIL